MVNHAGRKLNNMPSAMTVLPWVADALTGRLPIVLNGGVNGSHGVLPALALGASVFVLVSPAPLLAAPRVVKSVYEHLRNELVMTMQLSGTPTIKSIVQGGVAGAKAWIGRPGRPP
ncbi:MAG: alpha-hydroxy-acid oxidizing protein [Xanthobacteraceae bacterium]|nr:alpha-hydroxy-acid oxidizing protein [Xanthobacteraceae bacterium]